MTSVREEFFSGILTFKMSSILIIGVKFAEYGNAIVTATHKLTSILASAGATVYVTSVTVDEDEQQNEKRLAEEVTNYSEKQVCKRSV